MSAGAVAIDEREGGRETSRPSPVTQQPGARKILQTDLTLATYKTNQSSDEGTGLVINKLLDKYG